MRMWIWVRAASALMTLSWMLWRLSAACATSAFAMLGVHAPDAPEPPREDMPTPPNLPPGWMMLEPAACARPADSTPALRVVH